MLAVWRRLLHAGTARWLPAKRGFCHPLVAETHIHVRDSSDNSYTGSTYWAATNAQSALLLCSNASQPWTSSSDQCVYVVRVGCVCCAATDNKRHAFGNFSLILQLVERWPHQHDGKTQQANSGNWWRHLVVLFSGKLPVTNTFRSA